MLNPCRVFKVQFYTNNFFKAELNSCHPTQRAISELLQKRDERFELQRSSSHALISIRFVCQTGGRKASKYSQTYKSKQWYQWWTFSVFKKTFCSNTRGSFEQFSFEAFFPGLYKVIIRVIRDFWIVFVTLAVCLYGELSVRVKVPQKIFKVGFELHASISHFWIGLLGELTTSVHLK